MKKTAVIIIALALVLGSLAACGSAKETSDGYYKEETAYDSGYGYTDNESYYDSADYGSDSSPADSGKKSDYQAIADASSRKLIRDADIDVETQDFDGFGAELNFAVKEFGGYVQSSSESGSNYSYSKYRSLTVKIRIPADKLDDFLGRISEAATITSKAISVKDITGDYIDTESRIKALETEYDALLAILAKADSVADLITVQDRLTEVNAELQSCKAKLKAYDEMVAYSTVDMYVREVERLSATEQETFGQRLKQRFGNSLYDVGTGIVNFTVWFLGSLPYFIVIAAIIFVIVLIIRRSIRKIKAKKANGGTAVKKEKKSRKEKKAEKAQTAVGSGAPEEAPEDTAGTEE